MVDYNSPIQGAPNFTIAELIRSTTADRLGLNNTPTPKALENLILLAQNALQPCRDALGITIINSAYRAPAVNNAVGGSSTSWHVKGCAADIVVRGKSLWEVFTWFYRNVTCVELIAEELPSGWIHVAWTKDYTGPTKTKYKLVNGSVRSASYSYIEQIFRNQRLI